MLLDKFESIELVNKFKDLPRRDRRAIEKKLSESERQILKTLLGVTPELTEVTDTTLEDPKHIDMKHLSPWLSKHLKKKVFNNRNSGENIVSGATLAILPEIIAASKEA